MTRIAIVAIVCAAVASGCGKPHELPVSLKSCTGAANGITANVRNDADRPIKSLHISADFYTNFRFVRNDGTASFPGGLNPGDSKDATFLSADAPPAEGAGRASRCIATHIEFLDGTTADLPPGAR